VNFVAKKKLTKFLERMTKNDNDNEDANMLVRG